MRKRLVAGAAIAALGWLASTAGAAVPAVVTSVPISPIRHVVIIFAENHSFNSVLGFWCDGHPHRCPDGGLPRLVTLGNGAEVKPTADPDKVPYVDHNPASQRLALANNWQDIAGCRPPKYECVSGYKPSRIPNLVGLAQHFAISDKTFSLAASPSFDGHIAIVAASEDGFYSDNPSPVLGVQHHQGWGCDSGKVATWTTPSGRLKQVPSCIPDYSLGLPHGGAFRKTPVHHIPTIMDRLDGAGLSWKLYGAIPGQNGYVYAMCPTFADCLYSNQANNMVTDRRFMVDAEAGTLPSFSVVTPGGPDYVNNCHNGMSMTACDNWIGQLVSAVENGSDWSSTAIFITFDDCGCFYDQVRPPIEPDGTQAGPRVPVIIVSPFARPGYTDTTSTTFAGILAYTEHLFGLTPLGVNDASAYDFRNAFNYAQAPLKPVPMVSRPLPRWAEHIRLTPALENDPT
jgi:phospholipase C